MEVEKMISECVKVMTTIMELVKAVKIDEYVQAERNFKLNFVK